jgi:hypothetical protein
MYTVAPGRDVYPEPGNVSDSGLLVFTHPLMSPFWNTCGVMTSSSRRPVRGRDWS